MLFIGMKICTCWNNCDSLLALFDNDIVLCEISHRLESGLKHSSKGCRNLFLVDVASRGLGLLPLVSEPDTEQCASEDLG